MFSSEETRIGEKCKTSALWRENPENPSILTSYRSIRLREPKNFDSESNFNFPKIFFLSSFNICKIVSCGEKKDWKKRIWKKENSGKLLNFCLSANPFDLPICWEKIYNCFGMWGKFSRILAKKLNFNGLELSAAAIHPG